MNKILTGLLLLVLLFTGGSTVVGQVENSERVSVEFTSARGEALSAKCAAIVERLQTISQSVQAAQAKSFNLQTGLTSAFVEFGNQAESSGVDVAEITRHMSEVSNTSGQLSAAWQRVLTALNTQDEQKIDCQAEDFNPEDLHKVIEEAKVALDDLESVLSTFIELVGGEIKTELAQIRGQLADRE